MNEKLIYDYQQTYIEEIKRKCTQLDTLVYAQKTKKLF